MKIALTSTLTLLSFIGFTQSDPAQYLVDNIDITKIDSTEKALIESCMERFHSEKDDTLKVAAITDLIENSYDQNIWPAYNRWLKTYTEQQLKQTKNTNKIRFYEKTLGLCISNIGYMHMMTGEANKALIQFKKCLPIYEKHHEPLGLAHTYNNMASVFQMQGRIQEALEYFQLTLENLRKAKDESRIGTILNNMAAIYEDNGDIEVALNTYKEAANYDEKSGNLNGLSVSYNNIAIIYSDRKDYENAIDYHTRSLNILKNFPSDYKGLGTGYYNIGEMYYEMHLPDSSKKYIDEALNYFNQCSYKIGIANCNRSYSNLAYDEGNYSAALRYAEKSKEIAQETGFPNQISQSAKSLTRIYRKLGKWKDALTMYKLHISMEDSMSNDATQKAVAKQQAQYEYEKQKVLDDAEHEKQLAIEQEAKEKQQILTYATGGGLGLVGVFLFFVFNRLKVTRKQKGIIEEAHAELGEKNQEILDSITYAKRIQSAILPPDKVVREYLTKSFILYKPKDIVAGDFYWMEPIDEGVLFAAADCTGHGVPGAMVSVVCNNGLNRSVREHGLTDPGKILEQTRDIVVQEFEKSEEEVKDGMDIALCSLKLQPTDNKQQTTSATLEYAGAHNPLWIIRKEASEIEEIKANKQPIGQTDNPSPYTTHKVKLNEGDTIYVFSDGFADQFGGVKGKKFKSVNFKNLLLSICQQPMAKQRVLIDEAFEQWKGELEQLDDVCVIGVRV